MKKKIIALVTSIMMIISLMPAWSAFADAADDEHEVPWYYYGEDSYYYDEEGDYINLRYFDAFLDTSSCEYSGKECRPKVIVSDLVEGKDFTVTYYNNIYPGVAVAYIEGIGSYRNDITLNFKITTDKKSFTYDDIDFVKYSYCYTGNPIIPDFTVKNAIEGVDYKVTYENNVDIGMGKIIVTGIGDCIGRVETSFEILPAKPVLTAVKATTSFAGNIRWEEQSNADCYEIRYSKYSTMKSSKTIYFDKEGSGSKNITRLVPNTKYYVQVRSIVYVGADAYISPWSNKMSFTTKNTAFYMTRPNWSGSSEVPSLYKVTVSGNKVTMRGSFRIYDSYSGYISEGFSVVKPKGTYTFNLTSKTKFYDEWRKLSRSKGIKYLKNRYQYEWIMNVQNGKIVSIRFTS